MMTYNYLVQEIWLLLDLVTDVSVGGHAGSSRVTICIPFYDFEGNENIALTGVFVLSVALIIDRQADTVNRSVEFQLQASDIQTAKILTLFGAAHLEKDRRNNGCDGIKQS